MYRKLMSPEEQFAVIRSFKNFDKSGDHVIEDHEFKALLKDMGRTDVGDEQIKEIFDKYDSDKSYFYVDPPYWKTENYYSNHDFDRDDHERLCNQLKQIKGKFSLSYYDFDLLSQWLPKNKFVWEQKEFTKQAGTKKDGTRNKGTELLIMNYTTKVNTNSSKFFNL